MTIIADLDRLLASSTFSDFGPNGLQVASERPEIRKIATAVSANVATIERAAAEDADLLLVHHGLFWDGMPRRIDTALHARLKPLFAHGLALAAYHLPLDGHLEHGNNALLAEQLGCSATAPFAEHDGSTIGVAGRFDEPIAAADLLARVERATGRAPLHFAFGPDPVESVAIVSGAGSGYLADAIAAGHDAFLTGEPSERDMAVAREGAIHYVAAGHYATETFGVRRLGELLQREHGVEHVFLDDPNPI